MKKRRPKVPATKSASARVDQIVQNLVVYSELAKAARSYLEKHKRLTKALDFRLNLESGFCINVLIGMIRVTPGRIQDVVQMVHADQEKFEAQVKDFADSVSPPENEKVLITPEEFDQAMANTKQRDSLIKQMGKQFEK